MKIPFGTITITPKAKQLVNEALETGRISSGRYVKEFEDRFAELIGVKEAVAVSSGTDADALALAVLHDYGAKRGDEIIVPALSFVATGHAVVHAGFTPVFVDIERDTLNIDVTQIEKVITENTKGIMPVHLMGKPADMDAINQLAAQHNLLVVEDAAEAHGATYKGKPVGSIGALGAFSLYIAHIISTGEGGIITTDNSDMAEIVRSLRAHGRACKCKQCLLNTGTKQCKKRFDAPDGEDIRFRTERIGYSSKMNELEAAIGLGNIELYSEILEKRRNNLMYVIGGFTHLHPYLTTIEENSYETIGPHAIPIIIQEGAPFSRAELTAYLEQKGIETRVLFSSMPTQCQSFMYLNYKLGQFPNAEYIGNNGVHVGVHQNLGREEMYYLLDTLFSFVQTVK